MTLEGFRDYTYPLMYSLGVLGTRKFITDTYLVKNIKYCVDKLKTIFVMYPEARYSPCGTSSYLPESLGKLIRLNKVPVVVMIHHGNHLESPFWNFRKKTPRASAYDHDPDSDCRAGKKHVRGRD